MRLTDFEALSFDCYGTLIDWEAGIAAVLSPWAKRCGLDFDDDQLISAFGHHQAAAEAEHPTMLYPEILARSMRALGAEVGCPVSDADAAAMAASVPDWPAFEDSHEALRRLGVGPGKLLHVAQSLFHDHVPAKAAGLPTVWINRRHNHPGLGATPAPGAEVTPDWEFPSMAAFAGAVDGY